MATSYPRSPRAALLSWAVAHAEQWEAQGPSVGLSPQRTAQYAAQVQAVKEARLAQDQAQSAAMAATATFNNAAAELERMTAAMVRSVRAFAAGDPQSENDVLGRAWVQPVRPDRGPAELIPAAPTDISVRLSTSGALELSWRCTQPRGTSGALYILYRRLAGEAEFTQRAITGRKRFIDDTIPAGTQSVTYYLQSRRGDAESPAGASTVVQLGNAEVGGRIKLTPSGVRAAA